ncbi:unnamed protein product [Schistosoma mattheei]|uniref:Uncharacterized protein n=1 Tax=Schistosoma mattheei TaxID=31246 RepID=A0A183PWK5_9TREM|nr:unnamed protein product [Schistosoma mattheei]
MCTTDLVWDPNTEKIIKRKLIHKQSINETFTTLKQQMDEIQIALNDLKYATSTSGRISKEDLLNLLDNLKTLRRKYTESIQTNDRRCQNFLNSAASQGDGDMLLNEMKTKISQMVMLLQIQFHSTFILSSIN